MTITVEGSATGVRSAFNAPTPKVSFPDLVVVLAVALTILPAVSGFSWRLATPVGNLFFADVALFVVLAAMFVTRNVLTEVLVLSIIGLLYASVNFSTEQGLGGLQWVVRDTRPFFYFIAGVAISSYLFVRPHVVVPLLRTVIAVVGIVAVLAAVSQVLDTPLVGSSDNFIYFGGGSVDLSSRRVQTATTAAGLFLLCLITAGFIRGVRMGRLGRYWLIAAVIGSVTLTILSYSRNSVAAILVALVFALLFPGSISMAERLVRSLRLVISALAGVMAFVLIAGLLGGVFADVVTAFEGRVVHGIGTSAVSTDPSVLWRVDETRLAVQAIEKNPLGTGFGQFYRANQPNEPFRGNEGRLYIHNFFLLWPVKLGLIVGVLALSALAVGMIGIFYPRRRCRPEIRELLVISGCALLGLGAANFVAPFFASREFAVFFGLVIGFGWLMIRREIPSKGAISA